MITPYIMIVLYILGAVIITFSALAMMFGGASLGNAFGVGGLLGGVLYLILGNLIWRITCEWFIVFFRMNDAMTAIEQNTKSNTTATAPAAPPQQSPAMAEQSN